MNGKFVDPPAWILYTFPWKISYFALVNVHTGRVVAYQQNWVTLKIDPRGHFTMLRCAVIVTFDKIMRRFRRVEKPLFEFCEFFANFPTW